MNPSQRAKIPCGAPLDLEPDSETHLHSDRNKISSIIRRMIDDFFFGRDQPPSAGAVSLNCSVAFASRLRCCVGLSEMPTVDPFGPVGLRPNKFRLSLWGCRTLEQLFLRLPAVRPDTVPTFVVYPFRVLLSPFLSGPSYHSSRNRPSSLLLPPCYSAACVLSIACSHWPTLAMRHIASQNQRPRC